MPVPTIQLPPEALQPRKLAAFCFLLLSCTNTNFLSCFHLHRLVEVWIPSVIKKGRGSDTHHAYQVYVKLGGDEWNVYRKFAEFLEFHRQISIHLPEVAEFNLPPKKAISDKVENGHITLVQICGVCFFVFPPFFFQSAQVVEERRQRLQDYLRFVLEVCSKPTAKRKQSKGEFKPIIPVTVTKDTFLQTFPFFR